MVYITGESDPLKALVESQKKEDAAHLLDELCKYNAHLDKQGILREGKLPSYVPVRLSPQHYAGLLPSQVAQVERDFISFQRATLDERKKFHMVQQQPYAITATQEVLTGLNNFSLAQFSRQYLQPPQFGIPLGVATEMATMGAEKLKLSGSYQIPKSFIQTVAELDALAKNHRSLKKIYGEGHPQVKQARSLFVQKNYELRAAYGDVLSELPRSDKKNITSINRGLKSPRYGSTVDRLQLSSKIGSNYMSYDTMNKLIKGSKYFANGIWVLGALAAGSECLEAYNKGKGVAHTLRPAAKWAGGLGGGALTGAIVAEAGVPLIASAVSAMSGVSAEAVILVLTCTPYGWVALAVTAGVAGFYMSGYGEEFALQAYDGAVKIINATTEKTKQLYQEAEKKVSESWNDICNFAAELYNVYAPSWGIR